MHISPTSLACSINLIYRPDTASSTHISAVMNTDSTLTTQNTATDNQSVNKKNKPSCFKQLLAFFKCGKKTADTSDSQTLEAQETQEKQETLETQEKQETLEAQETQEKQETRKALETLKTLKTLKTQLLSKDNPLQKQGIFRISSSTQDIKNAKKDINKHLEQTNPDIHLQCNLFKAYFKDSLTKENAEQIRKIITQTTPLTKEICNTFPENLNCLLSLLPVIKRNVVTNKMTEESLAIIFSPHLSEYLVKSDITLQDPQERIKSELKMTQQLITELTAFFEKYNELIENSFSETATQL